MNDQVRVDLQHDLDWIYRSAPLMLAVEGFSLFKPDTHLSPPRKDINLATSYPLPPSYRLGWQFEDAVAALLSCSRIATLLARNLAVRNNGYTLGELDSIYQNCAGDNVHLELAIKFFLFNPPFSGLVDFIGLGGRDRLDKKWARLIQHQLPLSLSEETKATLAQHRLKFPVRRELLLTGILFYPYNNWRFQDPLLPGLYPGHQRGWWLFQHQLQLLQGEYDSGLRGFLIVPRWHWIGGIAHYTKPQPVCFSELVAKVLANEKPKMVLILERENKQAQWLEASRGVVVRDSWPD